MNLIKYFLLKDMKARYAGSALGIFWTLLLPVFQILLYWFVFAHIMRIRPYLNAEFPYIYFLLSTYFFWLAISESMSRAGTVIIENAEIVKKVHLPQVVLPLSATIASYLHNMVGVIIFVFIFAVSGLSHPQLLWLIPVLALQLLFTIGICLIISAVVPYLRDLQQVMGYLIQGMFFLSPIIYSLNAIPEKFRSMAYLNPITIYIESYHTIIFEKSLPGIWHITGMISLSGIFLVLGLLIFNKLKEGFADIL